MWNKGKVSLRTLLLLGISSAAGLLAVGTAFASEPQEKDPDIPYVVFVNESATAYGGLSVTKIVAGNSGEPERDFNFTVTLSGDGADTVTGTFGDITFASGKAEFTLTPPHG